MKKLILSSIATLVLLGSVHAADVKLGELTLTQTVIRATPPSANVGGGYIAITNNGKASDTLLSIFADFAGMSEIHNMAMEDGVMKMEAMPNGLVIPAGDTVTLKPGGKHLMFMMLKEPLVKGEERKVTLTFEKAGEVELTFDVKSLAETMEMN